MGLFAEYSRGLHPNCFCQANERSRYEGIPSLKVYSNKEEADKANYAGYELEKGVNPRPIKDAPLQKMTWRCPKCGVQWKTFKEFLYDGCSPVYGANKRLEGI